MQSGHGNGHGGGDKQDKHKDKDKDKAHDRDDDRDHHADRDHTIAMAIATKNARRDGTRARRQDGATASASWPGEEAWLPPNSKKHVAHHDKDRDHDRDRPYRH